MISLYEKLGRAGLVLTLAGCSVWDTVIKQPVLLPSPIILPTDLPAPIPEITLTPDIYKALLDRPFLEIVEEHAGELDNPTFQEKMINGLSFIIEETYPGIQKMIPEISKEDLKTLLTGKVINFTDIKGPILKDNLYAPWKLELTDDKKIIQHIFINGWENATGVDALSWIMGLIPKPIQSDGFFHPESIYPQYFSETDLIYTYGFASVIDSKDYDIYYYGMHRATAEALAYWVYAGYDGDDIPEETSGYGINNCISRFAWQRELTVGQLSSYYVNSQLFDFMGKLVKTPLPLPSQQYYELLTIAFGALDSSLYLVEAGLRSPEELVDKFNSIFLHPPELQGAISLNTLI